jgi:hypothetical protein
VIGETTPPKEPITIIIVVIGENHTTKETVAIGMEGLCKR